ncbi:D-hexose-6-phosphate mutarotase [Pigmentiphaga sp. NML080357]|uniref:D-hexose-6-phosphate mutarotase n=1 Tax=Pigmentiphaga sp. NML080357 TaxID=2008675 RepID=UPI000B40C04C|nr:D-hexose-6-phosphate mutarotase [Pigmentiphaga sp. NML080357]OVZ60049.1 D-hexose-6-phosphate mutarotase [Pigmentiphaga sp. NML080357]
MDEKLSTAVEACTVGELPCWRLVSPHGEALVARQGAQLLRYTPRGQRPVVWLSDAAAFAAGQPVRGGIPVCWPWFGQFDRNPAAVRAMLAAGADAPAHGFVRALDWDVAEAGPQPGAARLCLRLVLPSGWGGWQHAAELMLEVRLDEALTLTLSTRNTGRETLTISQALHTYFAVSDVRGVTVEGLEGTHYVDTLREWSMHVQQGPLPIEAETDRIYTGIDRPLSIRDPGWRRTLHVQAFGSRSAVVWNPWVDKSLRLSQFRPDAWRDMLCIETARVWDDVLHVEPGATEQMGMTLRSSDWPA